MDGIAGRAKWRRILYSVGIVLGLGLLAQQAWQGYSALQQIQACVIRPGFLLAALALYVVAYFVQMAAWALIMRALQAPLSPQAVVEGYALSFLPRYIPGSVWGYLSRNEWLAQNYQVSYSVSTTASLLEAALLLVTAGLLGGLFWLPMLWQIPLLELALVVSGLLASWLVWRALPWLAARLGGKRVQGSFAPRQDLALWGTTTLLYVIFWSLQGGALVAITQTLCGGFMLGVFAATAAFALAWAIGFLVVFVPAGLGVREWTLSALLVLFAMLQPGQATLLAVVSRFGLIIAEVVVLLIGLHGQIRSRRNRDARIVDHHG
ncbi:MAG: flippase-like domain-containing protein [Caldilineaceae bacterium]|nr:flippase-like domain-containing protein [Caldilineaceae bacterium]